MTYTLIGVKKGETTPIILGEFSVYPGYDWVNKEFDINNYKSFKLYKSCRDYIL